MVEHCSCKAKVEGSVPSSGIARLAQWIERQTSNLEVAGSIPASGLLFILFFWVHSVTVSTRDSDSRNLGSNPSGPFFSNKAHIIFQSCTSSFLYFHIALLNRIELS